jgi:hypothetical protein
VLDADLSSRVNVLFALLPGSMITAALPSQTLNSISG